MIHRSQDRLVEAHADRILGDKNSAGAQMEYFEAQMREYRRPWYRRFGAALRRVLHAVASAFEDGGRATGGVAPPNDPR
jgi:hypothetical protein